MNAPEPTEPIEDGVADWLLEYDAALAAGSSPAPIEGGELPDECREGMSCLEMLERVRLSQTTSEVLRALRSDARNPATIIDAPATERGLQTSEEARIPSQFGRFQIRKVLGQGGCGIVFLAHDPALHRSVAIKIPRPEGLLTPELRQRFIREGRASASLDHPNIATVFEAGEIGGICYLASAYCPGSSLREWIRRHGASSPRVAANLVAALADAMHYAHQKGIWHRDLKPSNILLQTLDGGSEPPDSHATTTQSGPRDLQSAIPKIIDFGLAKVLHSDDDATRTGAILGTAAYMAPEQAQANAAELGPHTDVYALGVILFELLAGRPPFAGANELETMQRVVLDEPPSMHKLGRSVHRDLETICRKCLEKKPEQRYGTAAELAEDLTRFARGEPILARPIGASGRTWRWCRRNPSWALLLALACLVTFVVLPGWWWFNASLEDAERRKSAAEKATEGERQGRQAAEENASTQRYYSLLNRVRQRNVQRPLGWTWAGLQDVAEAAHLDIPARNLVDLRSEAATLLSGVDLREKAVLADSFSAYCLAFSPDGKYLAAGQDLAAAFLWGPVRVIDVATGQTSFNLTYATKPARLPNGWGADGANCLAFSADGRYLAVGARSGQVHCWDLSQAQPKPVSWSAGSERLHQVIFHPRQPVLYTVSHGGRFIKRWDMLAGKELNRFEVASDRTRGIALHKDGRVLLCSNDDTILSLDADSLRDLGNPRRDYANKLGLSTLCYSPDNRFLAVQSSWDIVLLLDAASGQEIRRLGDPGMNTAHRAAITGMQFSPDGSLFFSWSENEKDRTLKIWEVASGRLLTTQVVGESGPLAFAVHPLGKLVATAANRRIVLHDLGGQDVQHFLAQHPHRLQDAAVSATGNLLVCTGEQVRLPVPDSHFLTFWDTESGNLPVWHGFHNHQRGWGPVTTAFHPREPIMAATGWSQQIWFFDETKPLDPLSASEPGLLAFDRSGAKLWAVLDEQTVQAWDWPTRNPASQWRRKSVNALHRDQLYCLAAGRQWLLVGARDGQTHLLRTRDGDLQTTWPGPDAPIRSVLLSADETWAVVGGQNGVVRIMSVPDGNVLATYHDHTDSVDGLAIDSASEFLVSCSKENRVHIYTLADHLPRLYATLTTPTGPVRGLSFVPHTKRFVLISGAETALRVWDLDGLQRRLSELGVR